MKILMAQCNAAIDSANSSSKQNAEGHTLGFTPDQHRAILALLQGVAGATSHSPAANQIVSTPVHKTGIICTINDHGKSNSWILDTGGTEHICT